MRGSAAKKAGGIRSDPNGADDPEYVVRLVGQVVRVSVETFGCGYD
jgi:predicted helicase